MTPAPTIGPGSAVCALIPHYENHDWLGDAIESLLEQSRPPDSVIVIDDASAAPPLGVVARYPSVTLLVASENVGPYRLVQTVIDSTRFDAYLFQDADDISHPARLERLLEHAEASSAEMVGSFEIRIHGAATEAAPVAYPLDVNRALDDDPIAFALLHPTSLVARSLVRRAGGYPGGLRFGGDVEFLWRAAHVGRVVNVPEHLYIRRVGHDSLSGSSGTGLRSAARRQLDGELWNIARANARAAARGRPLQLRPFASAPPVEMRRLAGPDPAEARPAAAAAPPAPIPARGASGPVVVVGAPRSGAELVMWALDQHPAFRAVPDGRWLGGLAAVMDSTEEEIGTTPDPALSRVRTAVREALDGGPERPVFAGAQLTAAAFEILALHPGARFIHIVRDPDSAAGSLRAFPVASGDFYAGEAASAACRELSAIGRILEATLPSESVLRLEFESLVERPGQSMRTCLDFLGEAWMPACARPPAMSPPGSSGRVPFTVGDRPAPADPPTDPAAHIRSWRRRQLPGSASLPDRLRRMVGHAVPPDAVVSVVSKGDQALLGLDTEQVWHFPPGPDGGYAGEYPATGTDAVELLESARQRGATHFVVPAPGLWWLSFYESLATHLEDRYEVVAFEQGTGIVFSLRAAVEPQSRHTTRAAVHAARGIAS